MAHATVSKYYKDEDNKELAEKYALAKLNGDKLEEEGSIELTDSEIVAIRKMLKDFGYVK